MVSGTLFLFHIIAALYAFFRYKRESLTDAFLAVGLMVIVFAVGWTITTLITNLLFSIEWFVRWYYQPLHTTFEAVVRKEFNRDTISLLLLTIGEVFFYVIFFAPSKKSHPTQTTTSQENKM